MADTIRVLIADDHQLFRDGLKALLLSASDTEVAGEASTGVLDADLEVADAGHGWY